MCIRDREELSHYSNATTDFEFLFPFGWGELWGIADRTDFDLKAHQTHSGESMEYFDPETNEKYVPYCIEPSLGADRVTLAFLVDAYDEQVVDEAKGDTRVVMHFHPALAPFKLSLIHICARMNASSCLASRRPGPRSRPPAARIFLAVCRASSSASMLSPV